MVSVHIHVETQSFALGQVVQFGSFGLYGDGDTLDINHLFILAILFPIDPDSTGSINFVINRTPSHCTSNTLFHTLHAVSFT
jgi:hypothetical protein